MPLLGQPDAGIYRDVQPVQWPGVGVAAPMSAQSGPNAAMVRLGLEEQENQQIRQLAQQYGTDYDGLVDAVTKINPDRGFKLKSALEQSRKDAAAQSIEETSASLKKIDMGARWLQTAAEQPDLWPAIRTELLKQAGPAASQYNAVLPQPGDPELSDKLTKLVTGIALPTKEYLDLKNKAAQRYLDGDAVGSALMYLAGSKTPEQWKMSSDIVRAGGLPKLLDDVTTPEQAQAMLQAHDAAKPDDKPKDLIAAATGGLTGTVGASMARYMRDHNITDVRDVPQAVQDKIQKENKEAQTIVKVAGAGGPTAGGLSTGPGGGLEMLATTMRLTGRIPVGMARTVSKEDAAKAWNLSAEQNRLLGRSPAAAIQKQAMFQANAAAAKKMAEFSAGTDAAESKALGQIDIIKELSPKVWRTSSPVINAWLVNPTQRFTGNKDAQSLANAILTFSSEYAKIINGSVGSVAGASDSARNDAARLISNALNHGSLMQQLDLMQREMRLTRVGYDVAQQHIADQMQGPQVPGQQPTSPTPTTPASLREKYKY